MNVEDILRHKLERITKENNKEIEKLRTKVEKLQDIVKNNKTVCEYCYSDVGKSVNDPYEEEIHNKEIKIVVCDECYKDRAEDI